jgi:methylenetetrahydrofolate reductase (NADPH)
VYSGKACILARVHACKRACRFLIFRVYAPRRQAESQPASDGEWVAGRWGDNRSPAFGELSDYHLCELHTVDVEERRRLWGGELASERDVREAFAHYVEGAKPRLPWCARLDEETVEVQADLARLGRNGLLTINSQPRVNGAPSTDPVHGWGGPGGYVYQKAYVEFFCSPAHLRAVRAAVASRPRVQYTAVNRAGEVEASSECRVMAVTWGVFPDREVLQPYDYILQLHRMSKSFNRIL